MKQDNFECINKKIEINEQLAEILNNFLQILDHSFHDKDNFSIENDITSSASYQIRKCHDRYKTQLICIERVYQFIEEEYKMAIHLIKKAHKI